MSYYDPPTSQLQASYPRNVKCDPECDVTEGPCICDMNRKLANAGVLMPEVAAKPTIREIISELFSRG